MMLKKQRKCAAFTLVELLVALMVAAIVLTAAATMAEAMSCAKEANDRMSRNTAYLLQIQTRLSDLIMRANSVVESGSQKIVLWHDDNGDETAVDAEKTTIEADGANLTIYKNDNPANKETYSDCQIVETLGDTAVPNTKRVMIRFALTENGAAQEYRVCATVRAKQN